MVKVLDFGISKSPIGTDMKLTQTQSVLGTPAYMSPEQMRSAHMVDSRSDIWSLGCVLYEMIEGMRPFEAESFSEMCVKVAVDPPRPMVNAPPPLAAVIARCLAKQPEQRYSTMAELGRDLVPFAPNAPQAQHLVERMARMLRRSVARLGRQSDDRRCPRSAARSVAPQLTDNIEQLEPRRRPTLWPWAIGVVRVRRDRRCARDRDDGKRPRVGRPLPASFLDPATRTVVDRARRRRGAARPRSRAAAAGRDRPAPPVIVEQQAVGRRRGNFRTMEKPTVDPVETPAPRLGAANATVPSPARGCNK